jgi:alpha-tubulin suppressor-like RCC1 family protein
VPWHVPLSSFGGVRVRMAAAGRAHTAVVTEAGIVFTWGSGFGGQLGHGDVEDRTVPTAIPRESFRGSGATLIACGRDYTAAVVHDGALFAWGNNPEGVLGLGYGDCDRHVPALVVDRKGLGGSNCVLVACGVAHSAAVSEDGSLYTWGLGEHGRLGHGDTARRLRPSLVPPSAFAHAPVTMVDLGGKHSVAVTEAGRRPPPLSRAAHHS